VETVTEPNNGEPMGQADVSVERHGIGSAGVVSALRETRLRGNLNCFIDEPLQALALRRTQ